MNDLHLSSPLILTAVANRIHEQRSWVKVDGASYPPENSVPSSPWVMVRRSRPFPTSTKKRASIHVMSLSIEVVILIAAQEDQPREEARLDGIYERILDLFDANTVGGNINHAFPDLPAPIDWIWDEAPVIRQPILWGTTGHCFADYLTLDAQFKRKPIAIGGTP